LSFAPIAEPCGGHVGVAEPFLNLGDMASFERAFLAAVARSECAQRPFTGALIPVFQPVFYEDIA